MDLYSALDLGKQLMSQHGLTQAGWKFGFDNSVRRFGVCKYRLRSISLSKHLVRLNSDIQVKDTILHEIAHALVGFHHHHNSIWKAKCVEIGAKPTRCYSSSEVARPEGRYQANCDLCNTTHQRQRSPMPLSYYTCPCEKAKPCNQRKKLIWRENK